MRRAGETARRALATLPQARLVVGTGVAGALSPGLRPGAIVVADRVMKAREDATHRRYVVERVVAVSAEDMAHCERALSAARLDFSIGAILTSPRVLADADSKRLAMEQSGAIAVDMESAAIASEAAKRGIPFAVVRTVVDSLEDEVVGAGIADEEGRVKPLKAAGYLMHNPGAMMKLPRMLHNLALATRSLADAIEALCNAGTD